VVVASIKAQYLVCTKEGRNVEKRLTKRFLTRRARRWPIERKLIRAR